MSIRVRLALVMWLLVAAMGVSMTLLADITLTNSLDAERHRRAQEEAHRVHKVVNRFHEHLADKVELLGDHPDTAGVLEGALGQSALQGLRQAMEVDLLATLDMAGGLIPAEMPGRQLEDLPSDMAFRDALAGKPYQDMVVRGNTFEVRATRPIVRDGEVQGAILAAYLLDRRFLDQLHEEAGFHAAYTFEAEVLASTLPAFDRVDPRNIYQIKERELFGAAAGSPGADYFLWTTVLDGEPYDAVCCPLYLDETSGLLGTLVLLVSARPVLETRAQARREMIIAILLGLLLSTALAILLATGLTRPVRALAEAAQAWHSGDLGRRTGIRRGDELGKLGQTFDEMAASLEQHVEEVQQLAVTDGLTGLSNHRRFKEEFQREVRRAGRFKAPLALLFLDIDHFKQVNDTHGHSVGDQVLRNIADILTQCVRTVDLPCRYGGEEFAVILPNTDKTEALLVAERLRTTTAAEPLGDAGDVPVTLSAGVSMFPEDSQEADKLLEIADGRLYRAKQTGRNRVVSDDEL